MHAAAAASSSMPALHMNSNTNEKRENCFDKSLNSSVLHSLKTLPRKLQLFSPVCILSKSFFVASTNTHSHTYHNNHNSNGIALKMTTHKVKHSTEKMFLFNNSNIIALYGSEFVCNVLRWPHSDAKFLYLLWVTTFFFFFCHSFSIFILFPLFVCIHAHSHMNFRHNVQVLTVYNEQVHTSNVHSV